MKKAFVIQMQKLRIILCTVVALCSVTILYANRNIKFSVDMSLMISQGKFNTSTDAVYIKGSFNNWENSNPMTKGAGNIYSVILSLPDNSYQEYKYFITSAQAENDGWEHKFPVNSNGNRVVIIGVKDLDLAVVYYNDADINQVKSTTHFNLFYASEDARDMEDYATRIEIFYGKISNALQVFPTEKTTIYLYKSLEQLHLAQGYPENGDNSIGSAYGKSLIVMLSPYKMGLDESLGLFAHEFTHCMEAWKTKVTLPAWLNEGVACYYGWNFSTKDWIKSVMDSRGKPNIEELFNTEMGYAYAGIVAYFIIKTKGEAAMAKFVENMNYADIGYAGLSALQTAWWNFLDIYLNYNTKVNVKFTVDMTEMAAAGYFKPETDKVYVKGSFSSWSPQIMSQESGLVYSLTVPLNTYTFWDYKFCTNSSVAPNDGLEFDSDETIAGNRMLDVGSSNLTLPVQQFKFKNISDEGIDMSPIENKIEILKYQSRRWGTPSFSTFNYQFQVISSSDYESQKPSDNLPFDAGFVATDGTIKVCMPTTDAQKSVFPDISKAALYYLCQSYMYYFYQTREMPLIFKIGFAAYESGLNPLDSVVKVALNAYGNSFSSFDILNDRVTFNANNGFAVAGAFGEFMNIFKNWGYPNISTISAAGFDVQSGWWNVDNLKGLLDDFNRYMFARYLEPDNSLRIQKVVETDHFRFYTRPADAAINFPYFSDVLESAYQEYTTNFKVKAYEKFSYFTLPACVDGELEGKSCNGAPPERIAGGTAWLSGMHSTCASTADQLNLFYHMNRHEFAHAIQAMMPQGTVTAWLNEGFPQFCAGGPITEALLAEMRESGINALSGGTAYFGHRPTYEDTRVYPSPDFGYYTMGYFLNDYIYRRGGYPLLKEVQMNDLAAYQGLGYSTSQAFLNDFYFDFDVRVQGKKIVTLKSPDLSSEVTTSAVTVGWEPLKADVKLNVSVSTDNGGGWTDIASKTTQKTCTWDAGTYTGKFFLKFTAPDNLNLSETYGPFNVVNLDKLLVTFPEDNAVVIAGDTTDIAWGKTNVPNIKIEFSENNGASWETISSSISTSGNKIKWVVPQAISSDCRIRITDLTNPAIFDESDNPFRIVKPDETGGPYLFDKNTIALFHFDNNLDNRSNLSGNANGNTQNIVNDPGFISDLGNCISTPSVLSVPHSNALNLTGDWTIEAWVKFTSFGNDLMDLICKPGDADSYQSNYALEVTPSWGNVFFGYYFSGANSRVGILSQSPTLNEWYHVAFTRDTKTSTISLILHNKNRKLISSASSNFTGPATYLNSQNLLIGKGITGFMDEVRISDVVRNFSTTTPEPGIKVSFKRPADWGTSGVSLWAWTSSGNLFPSWPGAVMTDEGNGWFTYTFDETIQNVNVVFSKNGSPQTIDITGITQNSCYESSGLQSSKITVNAVSCTSANSTLELPDSTPDIAVYPQPATDHFNIKLSGHSGPVEYNMFIIDSDGRTLRQSKVTSSFTTVESGDLKRGLYIVRFISVRTGEQFSKKVIIQ